MGKIIPGWEPLDWSNTGVGVGSHRVPGSSTSLKENCAQDSPLPESKGECIQSCSVTLSWAPREWEWPESLSILPSGWHQSNGPALGGQPTWETEASRCQRTFLTSQGNRSRQFLPSQCRLPTIPLLFEGTWLKIERCLVRLGSLVERVWELFLKTEAAHSCFSGNQQVTLLCRDLNPFPTIYEWPPVNSHHLWMAEWVNALAWSWMLQCRFPC